MVLEFNWAYGPMGDALKGKHILNVITSGGARAAYQADGRNRHTIRQMLAPFDQTAALCKMIYLPPFVVQGTHRLHPDELLNQAEIFSRFLTFLSNLENDPGVLDHYELINDYFILS
jgi:glutathione-regulated potassium-efflux system ancillary protein KefG